MVEKITRLSREFDMVLKIIQKYHPLIDPFLSIPDEEYKRRQKRVYQALQAEGFEVGIVFSDEHYAGDVPYLGGNVNISIEQVAGVIGKTGFHIIAGLEGGFVAEQLAHAPVHKVELLQLADEQYPLTAERFEEVIEAATQKKVIDLNRIALLTPKQVIPATLVEYLYDLFGKENVIDKQRLYYQIKYEKSDFEMYLIRQACLIADAMLRGMLAVLKPGMLETEVAAWGAFIGRQLGSEDDGFKIMVGANEANRTLIGPALNRIINEGDFVHLGVAPKRDGLNACIRRSVIAVDSPKKVTENQRYWFQFIEAAYKVGYQNFLEVATHNLPAKYQEQALVDFFKDRSAEISQRYGFSINLEHLKPYTGTHNSGYTECQEFYGAITLDSEEPLGNQIVMMLDVALKGIGNNWDDLILPDLDFIVIENTLGKFGTKVETLTKLPLNCQPLVGNVNELEN
ncbi:MAG: M24 family metallopeptidase [Candidatus Helarchaeota archaeon]